MLISKLVNRDTVCQLKQNALGKACMEVAGNKMGVNIYGFHGAYLRLDEI